MQCRHPKERRELLHGYDVLCGYCGEAIGTVALFPRVVLNIDEAIAVLERLPAEGGSLADREARAKLERTAAQRRARFSR